MQRKVGDWDVTTDARPDDVVLLFERVIPTGIEHGTVTVLTGKSAIEVTTFRGESSYSDGRHPDRVEFLSSLQEDLKRRDFTINSIAYDFMRKRLIDPYKGQKDILRRQIRAVGNPLERFAEDGLRAMRAIRFASVLDFEIEKKTFAAINPSIDTFKKVAPERIRVELLKILESKNAHQGIELMRSSGLLAEVIPELLNTIDFSQNRFHRHDVYQHSIQCLKYAKGDGVFKLAVLLHDIGKPNTAGGSENERTFYGHEKESARLADLIMARLRFSNQERQRVATIIENHMFHYQSEWTDGAVRRLIRRVGKENLNDMWEMRRADAWGRSLGLRSSLANLKALKSRVEKVVQEQGVYKVSDLAIGGKEVMKILNIKPSKKVGIALDALLEVVLDNPSLNNPDLLIASLKKMDI
jgi:putative nucleotidyltransferase with HDIG domain